MARIIASKIAAERRAFSDTPHAMQLLLAANGLYALVLPVIEIFVAAFIMRSSRSPATVVLYQLIIYAATPVGFTLNGFFLRRVAANRLYAVGMILTGVALFYLMMPTASGRAGSVASAVVLGVASGLFWANRGCLVLAITQDRHRNYYYGIETCIITVTSVFVPLAVAWLFSHAGPAGQSAITGKREYGILSVASLVVATLAGVAIGRGSMRLQAPQKLLFFRSHPIWRRMLCLAILKAIPQGYIVTAPALLIFSFVGREQTLGIIEAVGGCVAAVCLYCIGRLSKPEHRIAVLTIGQLTFLAGSLVSAIFFDETGALVFMACLLAAKPLIDFGYYPIQFYVTNIALDLERRGDYSYIMSHECATFVGRLIGCGVFLGITSSFSDVVALRYALPIIAFLQLPSVPLARNLIARCRRADL